MREARAGSSPATRAGFTIQRQGLVSASSPPASARAEQQHQRVTSGHGRNELIEAGYRLDLGEDAFPQFAEEVAQ